MLNREITEENWEKFYTDFSTESGWSIDLDAQLGVNLLLSTPTGSGQSQMYIPRDVWDKTVEWFLCLSESGFWETNDIDHEMRVLHLGEDYGDDCHEWQIAASIFFQEGFEKFSRSPTVSIHVATKTDTVGVSTFSFGDFKSIVDWYNSGTAEEAGA